MLATALLTEKSVISRRKSRGYRTARALHKLPQICSSSSDFDYADFAVRNAMVLGARYVHVVRLSNTAVDERLISLAAQTDTAALAVF